MNCYCLLGWKCPGWCMAPLCRAESVDFTSTILLPATHWKKEKATSNSLWTSSETQTSSDPDPSRGRKRIQARNKNYVPSSARSHLSRRTFKSKTFVEGTKRKQKLFLLWETCVMSRTGAVAFQNTRSISPNHFPPPKATNSGCCHLPGHITAAPKVLQLFTEAEHRDTRAQPQKKPV